MPRLLSLIGCVALLASACAAQAEPPTKKDGPAKTPPVKEEPAAKEKPPYHGAAVVLVDVRYILTHYTPLRTQLQDWTKKYDAAKLQHHNELKVIAQLEQRLNEVFVDSTDYRKLDEEIIKRQVETAASWKTNERRFLRQRAKLFADAFHLIRKDVDEFMKEHNIVLVLNFDGDPFPGTPLTIEKLSREMGGHSGSRFTCTSGWDCIPIALTSAAEREADAEESQPHTSPQRVEHGLRGNMLSVRSDHDVTPLILSRLSKKAEAEEKKAASDRTATAPKKEDEKMHEVKKGAEKNAGDNKADNELLSPGTTWQF